MPEREKVVDLLVGMKTGSHAWYSPPREIPTHRCTNAPACGLPLNSFDAGLVMARAAKEADDTLIAIADSVDWDRVLTIAAARHELRLDPVDGRAVCTAQHEYEHGIPREVCGLCIREALLVIESAAYSWDTDEAKSPRERPVEEFMQPAVRREWDARGGVSA